MLDARERLLGAILLSNNAVNIAASSLATGLLLAWFGDVGVIYATVVMTFVIVVFTEILPKTAAINAPDRVALAVARPMDWIVRLFGPVLMAIETFVRRLLRLFGINVGENQAILSAHEELRGAVDLLHSEGSVEKLDRDMFGGVLDLRELEVSDVMVHRIEMTTINVDEPPEEVMREVLAIAIYAATPCGARSRKTSSASCTPRICCAPSRTATAICPSSTSWSLRCRRGSCPRTGRSRSSSKHSAAARRISRWSSTSMAR